MTNYGEEKRRFVRAEENVCAWLSFPDTKAVYCTLTADLSLGGARLSTVRRVRAGERVAIHIQLLGGTVECNGRVRWANPTPDGQSVFGVSFLDLTTGSRNELTRVIAEKSHMPAMA